MDALLTATQLSVGHHPRRPPLVAPADLSVQPGQLIALLGPNGAGKSTLLRTLAGLQPPRSGALAWGGSPLSRWAPADRARACAVVLTEPPADLRLSVEQLVALGRTPHTGWWGQFTPADYAAVEASLATAGLAPLRERRLHTLSDGQRQRALIARALAQATPLLLLDEPTLHLDLPARAEVLHLLRSLASGRRAVVVATHDLDLVLPLADRLWLVSAGRVHVGTADELTASGALTQAFSTLHFRFDPLRARLFPTA